MAWSYEEFDKRLRSYWTAANARGNWLLQIFFALVGAAMIVVALIALCEVPRALGISAVIGVLLGFMLLGVYVLATAGAFHRTHCVTCIRCGSSLLELGEELEFLLVEGRERPETIECRNCHQVVISKTA